MTKADKVQRSGADAGRDLSEKDRDEIVRLANILYFRSQVFERTTWMGVNALKCPMDMWVYQELLFALKTDLLVETGTYTGGSALFFAHLFDVMGNGKVITIDVTEHGERPNHPRIQYLTGSSVNPDVVSQVEREAKGAKSVMVILDSDHKAHHKLEELELYAKLVTPGSYVIAEDTCFDYFPAWPEYGPGPATAVKEFLQINSNFELDRDQERHMITFSPMAFLKRR